MNQKKITVEISVRAHIETVWKLWTSPKDIVNWNFAAEEWCCPKAENDLRTGGHFNYRMESRDGQYGFDFHGIYEEVIEKEKIAYVLGDGRKVTIVFTPDGENAVITEHFDAENVHSIEQQQFGWQCILNNFKKYAESLGEEPLK